MQEEDGKQRREGEREGRREDERQEGREEWRGVGQRDGGREGEGMCSNIEFRSVNTCSDGSVFVFNHIELRLMDKLPFSVAALNSITCVVDGLST